MLAQAQKSWLYLRLTSILPVTITFKVVNAWSLWHPDPMITAEKRGKSRTAWGTASSSVLACASKQGVPLRKDLTLCCNCIIPFTKSHFEVTFFLVQYFNTLNAITSLLIYLSLQACVWTWFIEWVLCQLTCNRLHNIQRGSFAWHYIRGMMIATQSNVNEFWEAPSFMLSCTESYYYLLP